MSVRRLRTAVHLILDWDGTLTVDDTMNSLAKVAQRRNARSVAETHKSAATFSAQGCLKTADSKYGNLQDESGNEYSLMNTKQGAQLYPDEQQLDLPVDSSETQIQECKTTWQEISDAYMQEYTVHKKAHYPQQPVDDESYRKYLESFRNIELRSRQRVATSGFFKGVTAADVVRNAQETLQSGEVKLREGWVELFEMFFGHSASGSKLSILSVNWSSTYIRHLLLQSARHVYHTKADQPRLNELLCFIDGLDIIANDLDGLNVPEGSSGCIVGNVSTSKDKLGCMPLSIHRKIEQSNADNRLATSPLTLVQFEDSKLVVYAGDSRTDYECLKAADVGLWLCDDDGTQANEKFQQTFAPLKLPALLPSTHINAEMYGQCWYGWVRNMVNVADYLATIHDGSISGANGRRRA